MPALLGRLLELGLMADSGLAGLIVLIKAHRGQDLFKDDAGRRALHARPGADFAAGRQTAVEWKEIADEARAVVANSVGETVASV